MTEYVRPPRIIRARVTEYGIAMGLNRQESQAELVRMRKRLIRDRLLTYIGHATTFKELQYALMETLEELV